MRPSFENEGSLALSFPDGKTVRVAPPPPQSPSSSGSGGAAGAGNLPAPSGHTARKEFEFDRVLGPQVSQEALFAGLQTRVQAALDGSNVLLLAYGQSGSGKSHTMVRQRMRMRYSTVMIVLPHRQALRSQSV